MCNDRPSTGNATILIGEGSYYEMLSVTRSAPLTLLVTMSSAMLFCMLIHCSGTTQLYDRERWGEQSSTNLEQAIRREWRDGRGDRNTVHGSFRRQRVCKCCL